MIKKILYQGILFLFCFATIQAQDKPFQREFSIGANGGITLSKINFSSSDYPVPQEKTFLQSTGGITARYITEKYFGLQAELNLAKRGWKEYDEDDPDFKYTKSLLYIELPVFTHIYFGMSKRMRMVFNLGPQISYMISEKVLDYNVKTSDNENPQYSDVQRPFDWGLCGGAGLELQTGIGRFLAEGRYYFGLSDIFDNSKSDPFSISSNQIIYVKLSYLFDLK